MKRNSYIIILVLSIIIISIIPLIIFFYHFKNQVISSEISDWASFGDYVGGTINTILSFLSLIILGYLTFMINKISNKENKKLNLLERKLDAYHELSSYSPKMNSFLLNMNRNLKKFASKIGHAENIYDENFLNAKKEFIQNSDLFIEFYYYIFSFKVRYSHLFEYDFDNEDYKLLLESSSNLSKHFNSIIDYFELNEGDFTGENPDFKLFISNLVKFINSLRDELK